MKKMKSWLCGILILQILITTGIFWNRHSQPQANPQQPLLSFELQRLDKVVFSDSENTVTLIKFGDQWLLPELQKLPVSDSQITGLLAKLQHMKTGWPVATTSASHERFEVEEGKFQRRIQLYQGDILADELFVGTSPGFRKTHIRKLGDDAIYTAELDSYEVPVKNNGWLDKSLLASTAIDSIKGPDYALRKTDDQWTLATTSTQAEEKNKEQTALILDMEKAAQLASALISFRVNEVASDPPLPASPDAMTTTLEVSGPDDNWTYLLTQSGDNYYVSRNDRDVVFNVSKFIFERVANSSYSQLLKQPESAENFDGTIEPISEN